MPSGLPSRRRSSGASRGSRSSDTTGDLFAYALDNAVHKALSTTLSPIPEAAPATKPEQASENALRDLPPDAPPAEPIPARMLNEFVYCPRLFYYMHVEGVFVESADTRKGTALHRRVDKGNGELPPASRADGPPSSTGTEPLADIIHSRSVCMGSERWGVVAKMDLIEAATTQAGSVESVIPVDYKAGSPREGIDGKELWDTDRMQIGLQMLVLRDNGYRCDEGVIYYRGTKQRIPIPWTPDLQHWIAMHIAHAREVERGTIPPPLVDSPKCVRCSLAPVCLPDETRLLPAQPDAGGPEHGPLSPAPRRLMAPREDTRALYLNTQGLRVGCTEGVLTIKDKDHVLEHIRVGDLSHVAVFGNIQVTTQTLHLLCERDIPVTWFSMGGWFYGVTRGLGLKNVLSRIAQFKAAADPVACLRLARQFVRGKIHNARVMLMRNHRQLPERVRLRLGRARDEAVAAGSLPALLGVEGAAASEYFAAFAGMICDRDEIPLDDTPTGQEFGFDFRGRNRRPPTDPVNALLSLAYSLLAKECTIAAMSVGLDPYVGFYHQPRHGRPALALDVMEEFRPIVADSAVLTAINNRFVCSKDFVTAGKAVNLSTAGRKGFFACFEQRMNTMITHPVFDYRVSYRRALELQFRLLAKVLEGELDQYPPFMTR